jgi:hypothetical protein
MKHVALALVVWCSVGIRPCSSAETCQTVGNLTHCWDANTGELRSTTEQGNGGYSHTWTPKGENFTTWDHDGLSNTWRSR